MLLALAILGLSILADSQIERNLDRELVYWEPFPFSIMTMRITACSLRFLPRVGYLAAGICYGSAL